MRVLARKYARVVGYALRHWPKLLAILGLTLLLAAVAALAPWPLKILMDYGLGGVPPPELLRGALAAAGIDASAANLVIGAALAGIALFAANAALDTVVTWAWAGVGQRMVYDLAGDLFLRLQQLSLLFHARRHVGDSIARITGDAWCVHGVTDGILISPVKHVFVLAAVGGLAWQLDAALTLLTLTAAPLLAGSALYFGERLKSFERQKRESQARIASFLHQVLGAMPLVQALAAGARNQQIFGDLATDAAKANRGAALVTDAYSAVNAVCVTAGIALVLYAGGQRVLAHELSLGTLLVFIAYLRTLETASRGLLKSYGGLRAAEASIDRVLEVLDATETVRDMPGARALPAPRSATGGEVAFDRVSFAYEPGRPVLKEISLRVGPGETVALVGDTGAGKSTLASLIPRFFDPDAGRVLLDGMDLRELKLESVRAQVAIVLQEPFLLPLTIQENIAYGRPGAGRDEIIAAAIAANAHEFIRALPQGYDTVLGEQGGTLSGGERQRLAIARAILKDARVLILDEPTSALDTHTERLLVEALERLMAGRTTLIIAHRLSTVRRATRIAVLEDGRLIETGTHAALLAAGGRYARLYALQALPPVPQAGA
jgi:ATP-binding cassette subfamily B protein/subfamily B ATP-binding cassette protein MsbA